MYNKGRSYGRHVAVDFLLLTEYRNIDGKQVTRFI